MTTPIKPIYSHGSELYAKIEQFVHNSYAISNDILDAAKWCSDNVTNVINKRNLIGRCCIFFSGIVILPILQTIAAVAIVVEPILKGVRNIFSGDVRYGTNQITEGFCNIPWATFMILERTLKIPYILYTIVFHDQNSLTQESHERSTGIQHYKTNTDTIIDKKINTNTIIDKNIWHKKIHHKVSYYKDLPKEVQGPSIWNTIYKGLQHPITSISSPILKPIAACGLVPATLSHSLQEISANTTLMPENLKNNNDTRTSVRYFIETPDNAVLEVVYYKSPSNNQDSNNPSNAKDTIIYFAGNGEYAPIDVRNNAWRITPVMDIITFNYRGVGLSSGTISSANDLILDGASVVQFALNRLHIPENNIHFYGRSLGGAIALKTKALYPNTGKIVVERSFISTDKVLDCLNNPQIIRDLGKNLGFSLDVTNQINSITNNCLIINDENDEIIQKKNDTNSARLIDNLPEQQSNITLITTHGKEHNNILDGKTITEISTFFYPPNTTQTS